MTKLLLLLLLTVPAYGQTGLQALAPFPDQAGSDLLTNPGAETGDFTGWSNNACVSIDTGVARTGSNSFKFTSCNTSNALNQNVSIGTQKNLHLDISFWMKGDSSFGAATFKLSFFDQAHGTLSTQSDDTCLEDDFTAGAADWVRIRRCVIIETEKHASENFQIRIDLRTETGNLWIDDFELKQVWYPIHNFLRYPNFNGYVEDGIDPRLCSGTETDEICGTTEIEPPTGETLGSMKTVLEVATVATCSSGVQSTTTDTSLSAENDYEIDVSSLSVDTDYFLCTELQRTSDSAVLSTFPDYKFQLKSAAFWTGLRTYIDDENTLRYKSESEFPFFTYFRPSTATCSGCLWPSGATCDGTPDDPIECYKIRMDGYTDTTQPKSIVVDLHGGKPYEWRSAGLQGGLYFSPMSGGKPDSEAELQVQKYLDSMDDLELWHVQIVVNFKGSLWDEDDTTAVPSASTLDFSSTGGSISDNYVWIKTVAVEMSPGLKSTADWKWTAASTAQRNDPALSGSTNKVTVTPPACPNDRVAGYWIYAAVSATTTEPANGDFDRQQNAMTVCGGNLVITSVVLTDIIPETSDNTIDANRPNWINVAETDTSALNSMSDTMNRDGALAMYLCDECIPLSMGFSKQTHERVILQQTGLPTLGVHENAQAALYSRYWYTIPGVDPYPYGQSGGPDQNWAGLANRNETFYDCTNANQTTNFSTGSVSRTDMWTDRLAQLVHGSRHIWVVIQQWNRGGACGFPTDVLWQQAMKAVIGAKNRGAGIGIGTWGDVSVLGLENQVETRGHTNAWDDMVEFGQRLMSLKDVLIRYPDDSSFLATTDVATMTETLVTHCYEDDSSPVRWVGFLMPNGDQYILATNLCDDSYNITFTLANTPSGQSNAVDVVTGTRYAIAADAFTVATTGFDIHTLKIPAARNKELKGKVTLTGKVQ